MTTVALVDDHQLLRSGLAGMINSFPDYEVIFEASNGKEFIEKLNQKKAPEILILDITMPIMDGYETAAWIREHAPKIKILVLSMLSNDLAIIRMLKNGAKGYILKDSNPSILKQALDSLRNNIFYINELVKNKLISYVTNEEEFNRQASLLLNITENETQFLRALCEDKSYKEIAEELRISIRTIDTYRDNLLKKLDIKSRVGLVVFAIKHGIANV
jgi:two-component system, NarL family, invasion response regulator UvrY